MDYLKNYQGKNFSAKNFCLKKLVRFISIGRGIIRYFFRIIPLQLKLFWNNQGLKSKLVLLCHIQILSHSSPVDTKSVNLETLRFYDFVRSFK
jgi:hypothetical protein